MANIYYDRNAARKIAPSRAPTTPAAQGAPKPRLLPSNSSAGIRVANKRRVAAVLVAIALVLAWVVPSLIADASAELYAAELSRANKDYENALSENTRLKNKAALSISDDDAYDIAIGEYGMIRAQEDPVILPEDTE